MDGCGELGAEDVVLAAARLAAAAQARATSGAAPESWVQRGELVQQVELVPPEEEHLMEPGQLLPLPGQPKRVYFLD